MIKIEKLRRLTSCNTCDEDTTTAVVFKDLFSPASTKVTLCGDCLKNLGEVVSNETAETAH